MKNEFCNSEEMIKAGYCRTRTGGLIELDPSWRIGLPYDDVALSHDEVSRLLDCVHPDDCRTRLLFGLMFRTGARISQNLNVKIKDIDFGKKRIFIRRAKEGNSFYRYLDDGFLDEAAEYIKHYNLKPDDYLFSILYKKGDFSDWLKSSRPMDRRTVNYWLNKYAIKAGLQYQYIDERGFRRRRIHSHTAKYTVASWIYSQCRDSLATAISLGNRTTEIINKHYIRIPSDHRRRMVQRALDTLVSAPDVEVISEIGMSDIESRLLQR